MAKDEFLTWREAWESQVRRDTVLRDAAKVVATVIGKHLNRQRRTAWPSAPTIAKEIGRDRATVFRAIKDLKERGHIAVVSGGGRKQDSDSADGLRGQSNVYKPLLSDVTVAEVRRSDSEVTVADVRRSDEFNRRRLKDGQIGGDGPTHRRKSGNLTVAPVRPEPLIGTSDKTGAPSGAPPSESDADFHQEDSSTQRRAPEGAPHADVDLLDDDENGVPRWL